MILKHIYVHGKDFNIFHPRVSSLILLEIEETKANGSERSVKDQFWADNPSGDTLNGKEK